MSSTTCRELDPGIILRTLSPFDGYDHKASPMRKTSGRMGDGRGQVRIGSERLRVEEIEEWF